ncbi:hypothetical protein [Streptomyces sp. NBC_01477]|uniref:hypothetical protein n=1 Tax=Streptomyces sp. NBC_01477 TaxID=2976015 RepID=UPI002E300465|nr:hypothetical protein [Streptomyces sp. NBC_01477]
MRTAVVELVAWWAVLAATSVMLISSVVPVELLVAALAAAAGAFAARRIRLAVGLRLSPPGGALRAAALLPWSVVRGCAVLIRATSGRADRAGRAAGLRRIELREDAGADWAGFLLAASPDTCVVGITRDGARVCVHGLRHGTTPVERAVARGGGR